MSSRFQIGTLGPARCRGTWFALLALAFPTPGTFGQEGPEYSGASTGFSVTPVPASREALGYEPPELREGAQGYQFFYSFRSESGDVVIQEVETVVQAYCADGTLVYEEEPYFVDYMRFGDEGRLWVDFSRFGYGIVEIKDRHLAFVPVSADTYKRHVTDKECETDCKAVRAKITQTFRAFRATVEGAEPASGSSIRGSEVGFLARGPGERQSRTRIQARCHGEWKEVRVTENPKNGTGRVSSIDEPTRRSVTHEGEYHLE